MKFSTQMLLLLLTIGFNNRVEGQDINSVTGQFLSEQGNIPFATITVKNSKDSADVKFALSDSLGRFALKGIQNGSYFITGKMTGYMDYISSSFLLQGNEVELGELVMEMDTKLMSDIEVIHIRPLIEVFPDKIVFNVANTINSTGENGFDLLRKTPGVIIDNNNSIILEGLTGVNIYINGKSTFLVGNDLVNFLKSLQANEIESIEIITQPSAKFSAEGGAGIINFLLKKDKNLGTNGTILSGGSYGENFMMNSSLSINHRSKKVNVFGSYNNSFGTSWGFMNLRRLQNGVEYDSQTETTTKSTTQSGRLGVDWDLNSKHSIGVLGTINTNNSDIEENTNTYISSIGSEVVQQVLIADNVNINDNYRLNANLNYRYQDTLGRSFTMNADYGIYNRGSNNFQPNVYMDGISGLEVLSNEYQMIAPTKIDILTAKLDYVQNLWGGKISTGAKFSMVKTDNVFELYDVENGLEVLDPERSNKFTYIENVNAAYLNYSRKIKEKWDLQFGVRAEQTYSEANLISTQTSEDDYVERMYVNLFPSGGLTFNASKNHKLALAYSSRISRPNYQSLNPFVHQTDELSFRMGNPFLQPAYTNKLKLTHTFKYRFTTAVSYSYTKGFFAMIRDTLGVTQSFLITKNVANQSTIGLSFSLPFNIAKWWDAYISVNAYQASYIPTDSKFIATEQSSVNLYAQSSFLLPAGFKLELSGWYNSPFIMGGTYLIGHMGALNLAVQKKFLKDRFTVRLALSDILYTSKWHGDLEYGALSIYATGGWESRRASFTLSYDFGSKDVKRAKKRKTGSEDEHGRL